MPTAIQLIPMECFKLFLQHIGPIVFIPMPYVNKNVKYA